VCTDADELSVAAALRVMDAALDFLNGPGVRDIEAAGLGEVLAALAGLSGKFAAARAAVLARFDAARGHSADGYGSSAAWLAARGRTTRRAAGAEVRRMRQLAAHPVVAAAVARGELSAEWAAEIAGWTRRLPPEWRDDIDTLLVDTAAAGASLEDLAVIAQAAYEKWRSQRPDPDDPDDGFDDRYLKLGTTIDGAGRVGGNLTPECAAALQAVLEALGKTAGPEDDRTEAQRRHDALQLACQLLLRADLAPDRAGADARLDAVISLRELLALPGASDLVEDWLAALAGQPGYLAGKDAEVAACDAVITPVVTGSPDITVVDQMIGIMLAYLDQEWDGDPGDGDDAGSPAAAGQAGPGTTDSSPCTADRGDTGTGMGTASGTAATRSRALSPEAWQALRYAIARLAVDLVSGPDRLAALLRRGLLDAPYTSKSVVLDIGVSDSIPGPIRRAVQLRARGHCEWPGCGKQAVYCDLHHLRHRADGGATSVGNCVLLCQFHHDVCIHRRGWRLVLHPDATTTAYGPDAQVLHSHAPPGHGPPGHGPPGQGPPGQGPPGSGRPPGSQAA
jgi:hypothetical protein